MSDEVSKDFVGDFLQHFGVRGMKWGRRKDGKSGSSSSKTKDDDGEMSEDAAVARAAANKAASGGVKALSNKEIRQLVDRMNLEQNFAKVNTPAAKKQNPILAGTIWTTKKIGSLTGQSVEQVIKANLANEMNQRLKAQIAAASAKPAS